jgi:hypothetical protein
MADKAHDQQPFQKKLESVCRSEARYNEIVCHWLCQCRPHNGLPNDGFRAGHGLGKQT